MSKEMTWEEYADELKAELDKVKNQLAIAVEVLEDIEKAESSTSYMAYCALQKIKELENA